MSQDDVFEIDVVDDVKITKLYKYRTFCEFTNDIITKSSLWYANPLSFNDPFDTNPSYDETKEYTQKERDTFLEMYAELGKSFGHSKKARKVFIEEYKYRCNSRSKFISFGKEIYKKQFASIGVVCLSEVKDSILMWSHYSDNHSGLVFEFDYSLPAKIKVNEFPLKIQYEKENTLISLTPKSHKQMHDQMEIIFLTKYSDWSYEKEYRILHQDFQGNKPFDKKLLTKIIFGLKASLDNMQKIVKLCKEYGFEHVEFEKAEKIDGEFALRMVPYLEC